jgi:hypothetical protein
MTLQWTTVEIPLGAGLDTKTNEKLLKPPFCAELSDAVFPASGAAGYETRKGYTKVDTDTTVSNIDTCVVRKNELLVCADDKLYSVTELANNEDLLEVGDLLSVKVTQAPLDFKAADQSHGEIITHQGVTVHSWYDGGTTTVRYTVTDAATGTVISANTSIANSTKSKLCKAGNSVIIVYYNNSTTAIRATIIPTYDPTSTSDVELKSDALNDVFDACEVDDTLQAVFVAYCQDNTVNADVIGFLIDEAGSVTESQDVQNSLTAPNCIAVGTSATEFSVVFSSLDTIYHYTSDSGDLQQITSFSQVNNGKMGTTVDRCAYVYADSAHHVWVEQTGTLVRDHNVWLYSDATDPIGNGPGINTKHAIICSSAFALNDKGYVHYGFPGTIQQTYFLYDTSGIAQAKCCVGIGDVSDSDGHLPRVVDGVWAPTYRERFTLDLGPDTSVTEANAFSQFGLKRVEYDVTYRAEPVEYGDSTYITSGVLWQYDGQQLVEQGFHIFPEIDAATEVSVANGTGSMANNTSYSYRVYYEWYNANGERQRSSTAQVITADLGASDDTVTLTIPTLSHTQKGNDVSIVVYRTEGDPNIIGGAPFYRVSDPDPANNTGNNRYVANDTAADTVTFVDGMTDALLVANELDYLNSGELDNVAPESAGVIGEARNRVWLAGFEDESKIQFSKLNSRRKDQLEFHDSNVLFVPEEDGPVTAFGNLNHFVAVFKANSCYAISGEGPNNLGAGFFNLPQTVSLDVGCVEQRSIVNVPQGILFKSAKGIWRLGHNLDMKYVGAPVEVYNDQDITAATVIPEENHVIFLTSSGRALVYNYLLDAWSTFTNHAGHDACIWNGTYTYARTDGKIYKQSDTVYSDDGVHYAMKFRTAPVAIKGIQGKQKIRSIRLLGTYYSPHELRMGLRYDHSPGVNDTGTWDPSDGVSVSLYGDGAYGSGAYGGTGNPVYQARFNLPRQKCEAVQFEIDTKNTGGAGRAMSIQALQIEVGAMSGTHDMSVDRSFSATGGSTAE